MIGVVGFPRSGSSLVMQMLSAGGYACDGEYPAFESWNPLVEGWSRIGEFNGKAVKLLDNMLQATELHGPPPPFRMRSILLRRDVREQAKSFCKFLRVVSAGALRPSLTERSRIERSFERDYPKLLALCAERRNVLQVDFESLIRGDETKRIADFSGSGALDEEAMTRCIEPRGPECLKGMLEFRQLEERKAASLFGGAK